MHSSPGPFEERNILTYSADTTIPDRYHTCQHSYHSSYSETNLPPILFALEQHQTDNLPDYGDLIENGNKVLDSEGNPIRDFPFLPRYISVDVPGWLLEYWSRTDSRLTYKDIKARMSADEAPRENGLNMRRERDARGPLTLSCWNRRRNPLTRIEVGRVEHRSIDEISYNTTMKVLYNEAGQAVALRKRGLVRTENGLVYTTRGQPTYALNTFLKPGETSHTTSQRLRETFSLFNRLAARTKELGIRSWQFLPASELPRQWNEVQQLSKYTYDWYKEGNRGTFIYFYFPLPPSMRTNANFKLQ